MPDIESDIITHVCNLSQHHDFVFTSGGIGPTHDDITYPSIAKAFNLPLKYHQETLTRMSILGQSKGMVLTPEQKRMALFPYNAFDSKQVSTIYPVPHLWTPIVSIKTLRATVCILPGMHVFFLKN